MGMGKKQRSDHGRSATSKGGSMREIQRLPRRKSEENQDNVLAEAAPSQFWGTGLSKFVTENTDPDYWPGQNLLGAILSELTQKLFSNGGNSPESLMDREAVSTDDDHHNSINDKADEAEEANDFSETADETDEPNSTIPGDRSRPVMRKP